MIVQTRRNVVQDDAHNTEFALKLLNKSKHIMLQTLSRRIWCVQ